MHCIAPRCQAAPARAGTPFCAEHDLATPTRKGGWLSAHKRKLETVHVDADQVAPLLWVGGKPPFDRDMPRLDVLVLCAQEIQPAETAFHGRLVKCPLPDAQIDQRLLHRALAASRVVAEALVAKQRTLVTCAQGRNRSAFVAALALGRVTTMSADALVDLIRARRHPDALSNPYFVGHLQHLIGAGRPQLVGRDRRPAIR